MNSPGNRRTANAILGKQHHVETNGRRSRGVSRRVFNSTTVQARQVKPGRTAENLSGELANRVRATTPHVQRMVGSSGRCYRNKPSPGSVNELVYPTHVRHNGLRGGVIGNGVMHVHNKREK